MSPTEPPAPTHADGVPNDAQRDALPQLPPDLTAGPPVPLVDVLAAALSARGVRVAFGQPGADVLPLIDALERHGLRFIWCRQGVSAGVMADAAYQITGAPGLCLAARGPGALSLVSGVAAATLERSRVVAITGAAAADGPTSVCRQVIDQVALFAAVTPRSVALTEESGFLQVLTALAALDRQRPGPVHFDLPSDVANRPQPTGLGAWMRTRTRRPPALDDAACARARRTLDAARCPVVLVGCGAIDPAVRQPAAFGVTAWAEAAQAPVLTTFRAKGVLSEDHPLSAGAFGLSPRVDALQQQLIAEADVILAVGLDPVELGADWLPGWPARTPVISLDPWGQDALPGAVQHLNGPIDALLDAMHPSRRAAWPRGHVQAHRARLDATVDDADDGPASAVRAIQAACPEDVVVAVDAGVHPIAWSLAWQCSEPGTLLQNNGMGASGTALPMAISMKIHAPDRPVLAVLAEGGLMVCASELSLAVELQLNLVVVVFVDRRPSSLGFAHARSQAADGRASAPTRAQAHTAHPVTLIEAMGGSGRLVRGASSVEAAVRAAFAQGGVQLVAVELAAADSSASI